MDNLIKRILLLWLLSMAILHVSAYDFEEGGIYYNILPYAQVLGITELLYKALSDRKLKLDDKYLHNRYAIGDTLEQFKVVDSQNRRTH